MPGHLFEGIPVGKGKKRRGTATPVHRPQFEWSPAGLGGHTFQPADRAGSGTRARVWVLGAGYRAGRQVGRGQISDCKGMRSEPGRDGGCRTLTSPPPCPTTS